MSKLFTVAVTIGLLTGLAQRPGSASHRGVALVRTVSFGPLFPHGLGTPATVELPLHLSIPRAAAGGYQISAVASLVFTPAGPAAGGKSITASDIGVGITSVSSAPEANTHVIIAAGFDYDPANVNLKNGASPYTGAATGRATLTDLLAGREVLRAEKIPGSKDPARAADLNLTLKLGMAPQFFTPGGFSGTIILTVLH